MREQVAATSMGVTAAEGGKYLRDIDNALPDTEAWLSESQRQWLAEPAPAKKETADTTDARPGAQKGCLPLVLAIVLGLIVLAWPWVV
jgi:hypothetical protein